MKKFFFSTILSLLFAYAIPLTPLLTAQAQTPSTGAYACILGENTFFYADPDERKGLFLLPPTYYVRLLDYGEEYCRIEYLYDDDKVKRLVGYAKTNELTFVEYTPRQPYFYYEFDVYYRLDGTLIEDSSFLNQIVLTCAYYGDYKIGSETYCYVRRGSSFGYVPKPVGFTLPKNREYEEWLIAQTPPTELPDEPSSPKENSSPAQIAILVALCLLVPVLASLLLKPPRRPPYERDENY